MLEERGEGWRRDERVGRERECGERLLDLIKNKLDFLVISKINIALSMDCIFCNFFINF